MKWLLVPALLMAGCTTNSWTETTNVTRATGPATTRNVAKPQAQRQVNLRTGQEADGYRMDRSQYTADNGVARINLLPVALQCLAYGHDVRLTVTDDADGRELHAEVVTAERALRIVEEWRVQCRLGTTTPLRAAELALLDRLVETSSDTGLVEALAEIRPKVDVRPDWE